MQAHGAIVARISLVQNSSYESRGEKSAADRHDGGHSGGDVAAAIRVAIARR
jgi:hypothetical protein